MNFTFDAYSKLIASLKDANYVFANYHNYTAFQKCCILRHDVDFDIQKAVDFALYESELLNGAGVQATYFILVNTDFYNPLSSGNSEGIRRISSLGHEIGLHFDEMQYNISGNPSKIAQKISEEKDFLSNILGKEVTTVSMHRPSKDILAMNLQIDNIINSYSNVFFKEFKYISDSRMNWREDAEYVISQKPERLHILTHPIWYFSQEQSLHDILYEFVTKANKDKYQILNQNFKELNTVLTEKEVL